MYKYVFVTNTTIVCDVLEPLFSGMGRVDFALATSHIDHLVVATRCCCINYWPCSSIINYNKNVYQSFQFIPVAVILPCFSWTVFKTNTSHWAASTYRLYGYYGSLCCYWYSRLRYATVTSGMADCCAEPVCLLRTWRLRLSSKSRSIVWRSRR